MLRSNRGFTVWLTGLPCSGKTTIAAKLQDFLRECGDRVEVLDGDVIRTQLSRGLGFSREDRIINLSRIGFVAQLLSRNGVVVVVAAVSPYAEARLQARQQIGEYVEVYVQCSLRECERRDVKGMYARARAGVIPTFTGVDDPYEEPVDPEITVDTLVEGPDKSAEKILRALNRLGYLEDSTTARLARVSH